LSRLDTALLRDAFKRVIAEVEQEVCSVLLGSGFWRNPVIRAICRGGVSDNGVELAPLWSQSGESALTQIPAFVVRRSESKSRKIHETQNPLIAFDEVRKLKCVDLELQKKVVSVNASVHMGDVWVSVPSEVEMKK